MSETAAATQHTPAAAKATAAKPAAVDESKKTLTLTFEGKDLDLHKAIVKDAEDEERTPSVNVLRFLRQNYKPAA